VEEASDVPDKVRLKVSEKRSHHNGVRRKCKLEVAEFLGKGCEEFLAGVLLLAIWECQRNSTCPRRKIRAAARSGRGQHS
jgi:hypothetical protein